MSPEDTDSTDSYWSLVEPIWTSISIYQGPQVFLDQFRQVRPEVGHLFATHWCQSEVRNGGFHQFFSNPTGVLAPEAAACFRAIELEDFAEIVAEAMNHFGATYPRDRDERWEILESRVVPGGKWTDPFQSLNERFFELLRAGASQYIESDAYSLAADRYARSIAD